MYRNKIRLMSPGQHGGDDRRHDHPRHLCPLFAGFLLFLLPFRQIAHLFREQFERTLPFADARKLTLHLVQAFEFSLDERENLFVFAHFTAHRIGDGGSHFRCRFEAAEPDVDLMHRRS